MKYQINVPKKYTAAGQLWLNLLLLLIATIIAFTPILSIDMTNDNLWNGILDAMDALSEAVPELQEIERPDDNIGITSGKILTSIRIVAKLASVSISTTNALVSDAKHDSTAADKYEEAEEKKDELVELIGTEEGKEAIVMTLAIFSRVIDFGGDESEDENKADSVLANIIETIIKFIIVFYMLGFVFLMPYILLITLIINAIRSVKNIATPENISGKISGALIPHFATSLTLAFMITYLPGFNWGSGLSTIFTCAVISIVANVVLTRLRAYNPIDFKVVNLVQAAALLQGVGFIVFFTNLVKNSIMFDFFKQLGDYMVDAALQIGNINKVVNAHNELVRQYSIGEYWDAASINAGFAFDLILILVFISLAVSSISVISGAVINRLTLTKGKKVGKDAPYSAAIIAIITSIVPKIVAGLENKKTWEWEDMTKGEWLMKPAGSIFTLSAENNAALNGMLVGGIIMLIAAIAYTVAKKYLCPEVTEHIETAVLVGDAPAYGTAVSSEELLANNTAETSVAETSVAETPVAENTVAENTVAETPAAETENKED